jgi:peptidoglycan/LPS O-acetylase OafA/YrhL
VYTAWVANNKPSLAAAAPYMILTFVSAVALAFALLKLYDEPVRAWLRTKYQN